MIRSWQAVDSDEREKWVRRLEDTILGHANRLRGNWDSNGGGGSMYGGSGSGGGGAGGGGSATGENSKRPDLLQTFNKRVNEADAYLQLMIDQTAVSVIDFIVLLYVLN